MNIIPFCLKPFFLYCRDPNLRTALYALQLFNFTTISSLFSNRWGTSIFWLIKFTCMCTATQYSPGIIGQQNVHQNFLDYKMMNLKISFFLPHCELKMLHIIQCFTYWAGPNSIYTVLKLKIIFALAQNISCPYHFLSPLIFNSRNKSKLWQSTHFKPSPFASQAVTRNIKRPLEPPLFPFTDNIQATRSPLANALSWLHLDYFGAHLQPICSNKPQIQTESCFLRSFLYLLRRGKLCSRYNVVQKP